MRRWTSTEVKAAQRHSGGLSASILSRPSCVVATSAITGALGSSGRIRCGLGSIGRPIPSAAARRSLGHEYGSCVTDFLDRAERNQPSGLSAARPRTTSRPFVPASARNSSAMPTPRLHRAYRGSPNNLMPAIVGGCADKFCRWPRLPWPPAPSPTTRLRGAAGIRTEPQRGEAVDGVSAVRRAARRFSRMKRKPTPSNSSPNVSLISTRL